MLEYQQPLHRVARKIWRAVALPGVFLILAGRCCRCGARSATIFQEISRNFAFGAPEIEKNRCS